MVADGIAALMQIVYAFDMLQLVMYSLANNHCIIISLLSLSLTHTHTHQKYLSLSELYTIWNAAISDVFIGYQQLHYNLSLFL